jgi:hypothetical protein
MKYILTSIITLLLCTSCGEIKEEDNIPTSKVELLTMLEDEEETKPKEEKSAEQKIDQVILYARGSEPGWYAEFYPGKVKLELDYGKTKDELPYDFKQLTTEKNLEISFTDIKTQKGVPIKTKFAVIIKIEKCSEVSGKERDRSITISYNGEKYSGCASSEK